MKKALKIIMIAIMLLGIIFSISNFTSADLKALGGLRGVEVERPDGTFKCMDDGDECDILWNGFNTD